MDEIADDMRQWDAQRLLAQGLCWRESLGLRPGDLGLPPIGGPRRWIQSAARGKPSIKEVGTSEIGPCAARDDEVIGELNSVQFAIPLHTAAESNLDTGGGHGFNPAVFTHAVLSQDQTCGAAAVNGQCEVPVGGHPSSRSEDSRSPGGWTGVLLADQAVQLVGNTSLADSFVAFASGTAGLGSPARRQLAGARPRLARLGPA
jgi:hypothetical protein